MNNKLHRQGERKRERERERKQEERSKYYATGIRTKSMRKVQEKGRAKVRMFVCFVIHLFCQHW